MCEPATAAIVASTAVQATSQAVGGVGQAQNARRAGRANNARYQSVATAAIRSQIDETTRLQTRFAQESLAASQTSQQASVGARAAQGSVRAQAASRGVSGASVEELVNQYERIESGNEFIVRSNLGFLADQLNATSRGIGAQTQARISGAAPGAVGSVSPLALGLQMGATALDGYTKLAAIQAPNNPDLGSSGSGPALDEYGPVNRGGTDFLDFGGSAFA